MSALQELLKNLTKDQKPSRKRHRDEMVYQEVYNISKCQNTKMRSASSNDVSSSSKEKYTKQEGKN